MNSPRPSFYKKLTASVPLMVTVIVHVVLVAVAGYFVVSEQILSKKKNFEAANAAEPSVVQKQVEHRLQVARKGGGSASASPVSASRIFSSDANALQLPAPAELNLAGASALAGVGFGAGAGGIGTGTGYGTGIGSGSGLGSGFMSMSFLGQTSQRVSKVVFIVDISRELLDIRKGGFEAFAIIRDQIMKLISRLPPSAEFNVVLFERWNNAKVAAFDSQLVPATVDNKTKFFAWLKPVNEKPESIGFASVPGEKKTWTPKPLRESGSDSDFIEIPYWTSALHYSLEMEPDAVFLITGTDVGYFRKGISDAERSRRESLNKKVSDDYARYLADLKAKGTDPEKVKAAHKRAMDKAGAEFAKINEARKAKGKSPYIVTRLDRIFAPDFQAQLKRDGFAPVALDPEGWTDKQGNPLIKQVGGSYLQLHDGGSPQELLFHVSKLQRAFLKERATLNFFIFAGPAEQPTGQVDLFSKIATRNGGKCELLTTKRLKELVAKSEADK